MRWFVSSPGAFESESKILETSRFLGEYELNVENFRIPQSLNSLALYLPGHHDLLTP
jgi:hypothetical protein